MKKSQKKDELFSNFQSFKIKRTKLEKVYGGTKHTSAPTDITTGVTSGGNHDNRFSEADIWYGN